VVKLQEREKPSQDTIELPEVVLVMVTVWESTAAVTVKVGGLSPPTMKAVEFWPGPIAEGMHFAEVLPLPMLPAAKVAVTMVPTWVK